MTLAASVPELENLENTWEEKKTDFYHRAEEFAVLMESVGYDAGNPAYDASRARFRLAFESMVEASEALADKGKPFA